MKTFETLSELSALVGQEVAISEWITVTQERVDQFAQATGDHQWIHVDQERAKNGPFGGTIAHGFLTLSLIPSFFESAMHVLETRMGVNYGLNRVRFTLLQSEPIEQNGFQMVWSVSVEREGVAKPVCVAESIARRYP